MRYYHQLFKKNALSVQCGEFIASHTPRESDITEHVERHLSGKKGKIYRSNLVSLISEVRVALAIKDFERTWPARVVSDPIAEGSETQHYKFSYAAGELRAWDKRRQSDYAGIDKLALVNGLPLIIEVKAVPPEYSEYILIPNLRKKKLIRKMTPISEYYGGARCGYLLVSLPETSSSKVFTELLREGGIVAAHSLSGNDLNEQTNRIAETLKITCSEIENQSPLLRRLNPLDIPDINFDK